MRCSSCGFANPEGARFCAGCGTTLAQSCPACGFPVQADHQYCAACGHRLATVPKPAPAASERRQVTVLFCDLVGYTRLSQELDAEEVHDLRAVLRLVDGVIERFGGTIDKHIGDCVMAVFGAPVAHGNDPERAARAALAIRDAMPDLSRESAATDRAHRHRERPGRGERRHGPQDLQHHRRLGEPRLAPDRSGRERRDPDLGRRASPVAGPLRLQRGRRA